MVAKTILSNQMTKTKKVIVAVSVDSVLFSKIKEQAATHDRSVSNYVRSILKMIHPETEDEQG